MTAVLFDLDGTLIDSTASVARAWQRLADAMGVSPSAFHGLHGVPARTYITALLGPDQAEQVPHWVDWQLANECADVSDVVALPGARELLAWLDEQEIAWTIATSCQLPLAQARMAAAGIEIPALMVTADDVVHGKPDPEPYLRAANRLGLDAAACWVVEDAPAGMQAGLAAGARVAAVEGTHDRSDLAAAHVVMANLGELPALIRRNLN